MRVREENMRKKRKKELKKSRVIHRIHIAYKY